MSEDHGKAGGTEPEVAVALYRPHPGKDAELRELIRGHIPTLRRLGLVTARPAILMRAKDGTYIEIFEWVTGDSARVAHDHPELKPVWDGMGAIADFPALADLDEAGKPFPHFTPVEL